jgi:16S rRNA (cytosine967-C5)-methyltransferase
MTVAPARAVAYRVVRRVFEQDAFADRALHAEARGLSGRDRALATALAYGTIQRRLTLDHVTTELTGRPLHRLEAPVLAALRLGLQQLLFMDGIAAHAAVHDSVELVKAQSRSGSALVNAVLRRAAREGRGIVDALSDTTPAQAALRHSIPGWLAELWFTELGAARARSLMPAVNRPAESAIRVNPLVAGAAEVGAALTEAGVAHRPAPELAEGIVLDGPWDAHGSPLWAAGAVMPQSRGSMTVARVLDPQPGERVLDLCAAPGAKTTHLGALMGASGTLIAVERHPGRAAALQRTLQRMHVPGRVLVADAARLPDGEALDLPFDRVLLDPPCSGLGTLASRPDLRWRTSPQRIRELSGLQAQLLDAAAGRTRAGGQVVYSVCTISRAESDAVIDAFLARTPGWSAAPPRRLAPDTDATDGFYICRLQRD